MLHRGEGEEQINIREVQDGFAVSEHSKQRLRRLYAKRAKLYQRK